MSCSAPRPKYVLGKYWLWRVITPQYISLYENSMIYIPPSFIITLYHENVIRSFCIYQHESIISETTGQFSVACDTGTFQLKCGQDNFLLIYVDRM